MNTLIKNTIIKRLSDELDHVMVLIANNRSRRRQYETGYLEGKKEALATAITYIKTINLAVWPGYSAEVERSRLRVLDQSRREAKREAEGHGS